MKKKLFLGLSSLVTLQSFTVFSEYFLSVSIIYVLILTTFVIYSVRGLMLQKALSECIALILFMASYLIFNDDLLAANFLSFNNSIVNDYFAFFAKISICMFSAIYFLIIANFLEKQKIISFEYLLIILFSIVGLLLMCVSNDLLTAYLSIELSSLAFYVLAAFRKASNYSIESGVIYFITGAVSSAFFLLGSSLIYGLTGSINFFDFYDLLERFNIYFHFYSFYSNSVEYLSVNELFNYNFLEFGLTLVLFSLFIKLALAPFHLWSLNVYEGAPTNSTFFFAVIAKLSVFVLLIRVCYTTFFSLKNCWQMYSLWIGVISVLVGSFAGLKERKLKTLLAYSSASHMGYCLIAFSTGTVLGVQMLFIYMLIYMVSGLSLWQLVLVIRLKNKIKRNKYNKELNDFMLLKSSNFALALSLSLLMFSIGGIPPLVGFFAKMNIFLSVIEISFYFIALATVFCSIIATFYYIRLIKIFFFENSIVGKLYYPIKSSKIIICSVFISLLFFLFFNPTIIYLINYKIFLWFV